MAIISDYLMAYKVSARAEGRSEKTIRATAQAVTYFADYLGGLSTEVRTVTAPILRGFITYGGGFP
jgi:hypothetical protein